MFLGRVVGSVWSTVKWRQAEGLKLLLVRPYRLGDLPPVAVTASSSGNQPQPAGKQPRVGATLSEPLDDLVVCADLLDAGAGDDVVVAFGHAARVALSQTLGATDKPNVPIDAAVVAVVDRVEITGEQA
jgi:microcompartment protein CcmK/EutM